MTDKEKAKAYDEALERAKSLSMDGFLDAIAIKDVFPKFCNENIENKEENCDIDYEKKYKEALEQAKKELKTCGSKNCDAARQIFRFFPQLREVNI